MVYTLQIDNSAFRLFRKLPKDVKDNIIDKAEILKTDPLAGQALKGKYKALRSLHFSYKGSAYRVIYQVFTKTSTVVIRLAGTRENIYRRLDRL
jgi:mRNA-degrading endonuclease RelE of RelBE toxin-antitoxin system